MARLWPGTAGRAHGHDIARILTASTSRGVSPQHPTPSKSRDCAMPRYVRSWFFAMRNVNWSQLQSHTWHPSTGRTMPHSYLRDMACKHFQNR